MSNNLSAAKAAYEKAVAKERSELVRNAQHAKTAHDKTIATVRAMAEKAKATFQAATEALDEFEREHGKSAPTAAPVAAAKSGPKVKAKPGPKPKGKPGPKPKVQAAEPKGKPGPKPKGKPGPKPKAKPGPKPKVKAVLKGKPGPKPKVKAAPKKSSSKAANKRAAEGRAAVARGDRPPVKDAMVQVMGKDVINADEVTARLEKKGWLPNANVPRTYVGYLLSSTKTHFEAVKEKGRGFYRVVATKSVNGKKAESKPAPKAETTAPEKTETKPVEAESKPTSDATTSDDILAEIGITSEASAN